MADDKDKKLKELEEAVEKAQKALEAAGGVSDAPPIDPRESKGLSYPPQPTAPTSPNDQVRNAMGNRGGSGQLASLPLVSPSDKIAAEAKNGKGKKTQGEKIVKRLAEAKRERAASLATMLAEEKKNFDQAARRNEAEIKIREEWLKKAPSSLEMGIARVLPPVGFLMGTFDKYSKASEGASGQIEKLRDANRITDAAMGRAVTGGTEDGVRLIRRVRVRRQVFSLITLGNRIFTPKIPMGSG